VYDWNVAKGTITEYYRRQYPDGWVKVMPFSLRNILDAIKSLDHRLERSVLRPSSQDQPAAPTLSCLNNFSSGGTGSNGSLSSVSSPGGYSNSSSCSSCSSSLSNSQCEAKRQHQVVFLLTGSMNPDYGVFGLTQKRILDAVKDALPERIRAVNVIGHCMYGCASCSGVEHKVPLYFTRYFNQS